jgi:eukaryotic-like serine/threonine-protein kinase
MHECINDELLVRIAAGLVPYTQAAALLSEVETCDVCRTLLMEAGIAVAQTAPSETAVFRPGDLVAERYAVQRFIGRGGMGEVFEVLDRELHERVALKTIRSEFSSDADVVGRFKQELRLARRVIHQNVCRVFDWGVANPNQGEPTHFYTMELVSGEPLSTFQRTRAPSTALKMNLACQIARALEAVHSRGIVHRDLKPDNVMVCPTIDSHPRVVILDFGIARAGDRFQGLKTTGPHVRLGTPDYMAPEVLASNATSPASDVYSFGLTVYELLTGRHPSPHAGTRVALSALGELSIERPERRCPDLPQWFGDLVMACLAPNPRQRPAGGAELASRLSRE